MDERFEMILEKYARFFHERKLNCAETVLCVMNEYFSLGEGNATRIATPFGAGMCSRQFTCGALTGALMAIGLKFGRECGGDRMPAYEKGQAFLGEMEKRLPGLGCASITGVDFSDPTVRDAFSSPGGGHDTVCEPLVINVCRYLARYIMEVS